MPDQQTVEDLGKLVKQKYPQYQSLGDAEVGQKVKAKYPQYAQFADMPEQNLQQKVLEVGKGAAKSALHTLSNIGDAATLGLTHSLDKPGTKERETKFFQPSNGLEQAGATGENIAEYLVPIPGISGIKAAKGAGLLARAGYGALRGAADSAIRAPAQSGDLTDAPAGAVSGGIAGAVLGSIPPGVSKLLTTWGRSQYAKVLHPGGLAAKQVTSELLDESAQDLVGRGKFSELVKGKGGSMAFSAKGLQSRYQHEVTAAAQDLEKEYSRLAPTAKVRLAPVMQDMSDYIHKNAMLPNGAVGRQELLDQGVKMAHRMSIAFQNVPNPALEDVRAFRQILDKELFNQKLKINPTTAADQLKEKLVNSVREAINSQHPTIGELNNRVHFWKSATKVLQQSIDAKVGQEKLLRTLGIFARPLGAATVGGVLGYQHGGKQEAFIDAVGFAGLGKAFESPMWRTVSPVIKDRIAKLIVSGAGEYAADLATRGVGLSTVRSTKPMTAYFGQKATTPISAQLYGPDATLRGATERYNKRNPVTSEEQKQHPWATTARKVQDTAGEEAAGVIDAIQTPLGILTAGFGPAISKLATSAGNPSVQNGIVRALKIAHYGTRAGYTAQQVQGVVQGVQEVAKNPTPENITKLVAQAAIGAGTVATALPDKGAVARRPVRPPLRAKPQTPPPPPAAPPPPRPQAQQAAPPQPQAPPQSKASTAVINVKPVPTQAPPAVKPQITAAARNGSTPPPPQQKRIAQAPPKPPTPAPRPNAGPVSNGTGQTAEVMTTSGTKAKVQYRVVEADSLKTSFDEGYNAAYQPRDTSRKGTRQRVEQRKKDMAPEAMGQSVLAGDGAPIVLKDGTVITRNHGTKALQESYGENLPTGKAYKSWVAENSKQFGSSPEAVAGMKHPVLVRELAHDWDEKQIKSFAQEANRPSVAEMSDAEAAHDLSSKMTGQALASFEPNESGKPNPEFVRAIIKDLPVEAQAKFMDREGNISQSGTRAVQNAVFAKAYPEATKALENLVESTDDNVRNITSGMLRAAPDFVKMRDAVQKGSAHDLDIVPELSEAVNILDDLRSRKVPINDWLQQQGFTPKDPLVTELLSLFHKHSRSPSKIGDILKSYAGVALGQGDPGQDSMFGAPEIPNRLTILEEAYDRAREGWGEPANRTVGGSPQKEAAGKVSGTAQGQGVAEKPAKTQGAGETLGLEKETAAFNKKQEDSLNKQRAEAAMRSAIGQGDKGHVIEAASPLFQGKPVDTSPEQSSVFDSLLRTETPPKRKR